MTEATLIKQSEVSREIHILGKVVEEISESIMAMRARLVTVLKETPQPLLDNKLSGDSVPLATDIKQLRDKLHNCNQDIKEIISNCEL